MKQKEFNATFYDFTEEETNREGFNEKVKHYLEVVQHSPYISVEFPFENKIIAVSIIDNSAHIDDVTIPFHKPILVKDEDVLEEYEDKIQEAVAFLQEHQELSTVIFENGKEKFAVSLQDNKVIFEDYTNQF